jgi:formate dehydrogenase assembly factor FdhD
MFLELNIPGRHLGNKMCVRRKFGENFQVKLMSTPSEASSMVLGFERVEAIIVHLR